MMSRGITSSCGAWIAVVLVVVVLSGIVLNRAARARQTAPAATSQAAPRPSAEVLAAYAAHTLVEDGRVALNYRLLSPPAPPKPGEKFPLLIFLHGAGERGSDNARQLVHGAAEFLAARDRHPAYVLVPQCPPGTYWAGPNKVRNEPTPPGVVPPMPYLVTVINRVRKELPIDEQRIYVTGLSMGGFGTFDLVSQLPDTFAAAVPICGGGDAAMAQAFATTPAWIFHGSADPIVPPERSREMYAALKAAGADVQYTEYPGVGHDSWTRTYADPAVLDWIFSQRRGR